jgi:tRNA U34 5-methylaminomethyl-2-thiouridine-forming methyltransferase MnmC
LKREFLTTGDGSITIHLPEWNEQYHSKHGAIAEAKHVFIKHGLHYVQDLVSTKPISILEIGFGTGLNAFLTFLEAHKSSIPIMYTGIEAYPVSLHEINQLNYANELNASKDIFLNFHLTEWGTLSNICTNFQLIKRQQFFSEINDIDQYQLIYFDAFGARVQPELWTEAIFSKMYHALSSEGVLVTYSAKGSVRRAMQAVGFTVSRLPGPPGKREMLRAVK